MTRLTDHLNCFLCKGRGYVSDGQIEDGMMTGRKDCPGPLVPPFETELRASIIDAVLALPANPWWKASATDEMCPNCVTPWKCNGPHRLAPKEPDGYDVDRADVLYVIEHAG
jgi:hypothetical protein